MNILINENQLEFIQKNLAKKRDFELVKETNLITEKTYWYNTFLDFAGIVDPTGVVDIANGTFYMLQGEFLYGFLSLISAIPIIGDSLGKIPMNWLKIGAIEGKELNAVLKLSKMGKSAEAAAELAKISSTGDKNTRALVIGIGKFGQKIKNFVDLLPKNKLLGGLRKTILGWIELFENGAKAGKNVRSTGELLAKTLPTLSKAEQISKLKDLMKLSKESGLVSSYKSAIVAPKNFLFGGMPKLIGHNKSARALMKKTRFWAKFKDVFGFGENDSPDDVANKIGDDNLESKLKEYLKNPDAMESFKQDFGDLEGQNINQQNTPQQTYTQQSSTKEDNPFSTFFQMALS